MKSPQCCTKPWYTVWCRSRYGIDTFQISSTYQSPGENIPIINPGTKKDPVDPSWPYEKSCIVLRDWQEFLTLNIDQTLNSQLTPHSSPIMGELWTAYCEQFGDNCLFTTDLTGLSLPSWIVLLEGSIDPHHCSHALADLSNLFHRIRPTNQEENYGVQIELAPHGPLSSN